jgi:hypothetical protein
LKGGILLLCFAMMVGCSGSGDDENKSEVLAKGDAMTFTFNLKDLSDLKTSSSAKIEAAFTYKGPIPKLYANLVMADSDGEYSFVATSTPFATTAESAGTLYSPTRNFVFPTANFGQQTLIGNESGTRYKIILSAANDSAKPHGYFDTFVPESDVVQSAWDADITTTSLNTTTFFTDTTNGAGSTIHTISLSDDATTKLTKIKNNGDPILYFTGDREADEYIAYVFALGTATNTDLNLTGVNAIGGKILFQEVTIPKLDEAKTQIDGDISIHKDKFEMDAAMRPNLETTANLLYLTICPTAAKDKLIEYLTGHWATTNSVDAAVDDDTKAVKESKLISDIQTSLDGNDYKCWVQLIATAVDEHSLGL